MPSADDFNSIFSQLEDSDNKHSAFCLKQGGETVAFFTLTGKKLKICL